MADDAQKLPGHHVYADILHRAALERCPGAVGVGQVLYSNDRFQLRLLPFRAMERLEYGAGTLVNGNGRQGQGHAVPVQPVQQLHCVRGR